MSSREERETLAALFLLPDTIAVEAVYPTKSRLTLQISCTLQSASCPLCQQLSERIHGKYGRTVADVPCGGRRVTLALTVRKFVCGTPDCPRKIFTERLSDLVQSYARMTNRLALALQILGFATCGQLGERFAPKLGMQVSGPTLLRRMRTCSYAPPASVAVVGIDDWAWKKGATYGTILVDLQSHKPIDLLPDRTAETAEAWLRVHPEVDIVSRDRGGNYAAAAKKGAPQAQQIADRFHLLVRRIGACLDSFQRKEGLRAKTPKTVAYLAGKPKEDRSMRQRQTCPKAFTARSACLARQGEARLPNRAYQRREGTLVVVHSACCNVPEIHISS